ncbi:hypothetical protein HDU98_012346 [Podochytrium sp. JEL0797]|nr:hypothetical protein HDU98_012346 [Podochytrium sp. JEL0797]
MLCCLTANADSPKPSSKVANNAIGTREVAKTEPVTVVTSQPQNPPSVLWSTQNLVSIARKGPHLLFSRGFCPFTEQVRIAFAFKGVEVEFVKWDQSEKLPEWFSFASPDGTVPVMQVSDGSYISNSTEMIASLEKTTPSPTLRVNTPDVQEWTAFIRQSFIPSFNNVLLGCAPSIQAEHRPKLHAALGKIIAQLEGQHDSPFLLGTTFSVADLLLAPFLHRLPLIAFFRGGEDIDPTLQQYIQTLTSQPHISPILDPLTTLKTAYIKDLPKEHPLSSVRLHHLALKFHLDKCVGTATQMSHGFVQDMRQTAHELETRFAHLLVLLRTQFAMEQEVLFPAVEALVKGVTASLQAEHERNEKLVQRLEEELVPVLKTIGRGFVKLARGDEFKGTLEKLRKVALTLKFHMNEEEGLLADVLTRFNATEEIELVQKMYFHFKPVNAETVPLILEGLSSQDRMQYAFNIDQSIRKQHPEEWAAFRSIVTTSLTLSDHEDLVHRLGAVSFL